MLGMSGRPSVPIFFLLALLSPIAPGRALAADPPETFRDRLAVREAEIVVGLPPALQFERDRALKPEDFVVRVDGEVKKVIRLAPLARDRAPWRLVVVVDPALAHPDTIVGSLLSLASESDALSAFGTVDLATVDAESSGLAWSGRGLTGSQSIAFALAEVAGKARADRRRNEPRRDLPATVAAEHLGAIVRFLLADPGGGPRALALPLDPIAPTAAGTAEGTKADGIAAAGRVLAAYGWTLLPLGLDAKTTFGLDGPGVSAYDHWNDTSVVSRGLDLLGIVRWLRGKRVVPPPRAKVTIEAEILPARLAASHLAEATGGLSIDRSEQIPLTFDALAHRYVLGYEVDAEPKAGAIVAASVASARGSSPAVAPRYVRTGASEDLAGLLLSGLLAGDPPRHDLPVRVAASAGRITVEVPAAGEDETPLGALRISWAAKRDGIAHHEIVGAPAAGEPALRREIARPPGSGPVAVLVQAVGSEAAWGDRLNP